MKKLFVILAVFATVFLLVSCGELKFNNPNDKNSEAHQDGDTEIPSDRNQGELYGECYPNKTCNSGLICDEESNTCMKEVEEPTDTGDTELTDTGDTEPTDTGDTEPTDTGDTEPGDLCDSNPCVNLANSTGDCSVSGAKYICGCSTNYTWNASTLACEADSVTAECIGLPDNAVWNTVSTITQTWDGSDWAPSTEASFNETPSTSECRFKCKTNYSWNSETSTCDPGTRSADCTGLPGNAVWNSASSITQTWNGSDWEPSAAGVYSITASTTQCRFKCNDEYTWDNISMCVVEGSTKTASCTGLFANAQWNTASSITQTWNGSAWAPSTTGTYSTTSSTSECRFKCDTKHAWNGSQCVAALGSICTGQTEWSGYGGEIIATPVVGKDFFGQDPQYANSGTCYHHNFSLVVTGTENENIVLDNNTLLQWQQSISTETFIWEDAVAYCENLTYAGYDDWRLPAAHELLSIVDNDRLYPALDTTYFSSFSNYDSPYMGIWTSSVENDSMAFRFRPYNGSVWKISSSESLKTMCVRGNKLPAGSFQASVTENGDTIVTDSTTGLVWQQNYSTENWKHALGYCENLYYAGYSDWRLPNRNELASLLNYDNASDPYSDFPDMPASNFWSSSTLSGNAPYAFYVNFLYGEIDYSGKPYSTSNYKVRCVRSEICENNYFWNGSECVFNPCRSDSCNMEHATGNCQPRTSSVFECICDDGYFWNGSACVNPCDYNSCGAHSDGSCTALSLDVFYCGCESGYSWNAGSCKKKSTGLTLGNICTNQTLCYDNSSEMTCPAEGEDFFGQDAQHSNRCVQQNFQVITAENQNIVKDLNTGLQWQQHIISTGSYTWDEAFLYCENLTYAGYSNWRLPTIQELLTIVDNSVCSPAFDKTKFPYMEALWNRNLWSSTSSLCLDPFSGSVLEAPPASNLMCVRGNELQPASFTTQTISGSVVVTDSVTGLVWQKSYVTGKNWQQALEYCENLSYAGYTDWRLPNKNELYSLLNNNKTSSPYSDFPDMPGNWFWSSTTRYNSISYAWFAGFGEGKTGTGSKTNTSFYVRCVR